MVEGRKSNRKLTAHRGLSSVYGEAQPFNSTIEETSTRKEESQMSKLAGKVVIVTGASKGIGAGIARAYGEVGASVGIVLHQRLPDLRPRLAAFDDPVMYHSDLEAPRLGRAAD
jgi:hypothetical protein